MKVLINFELFIVAGGMTPESCIIEFNNACKLPCIEKVSLYAIDFIKKQLSDASNNQNLDATERLSVIIKLTDAVKSAYKACDEGCMSAALDVCILAAPKIIKNIV